MSSGIDSMGGELRQGASVIVKQHDINQSEYNVAPDTYVAH